MAILEKGDKAPDFELPSDTGAKVKLSALKGHPVVLYFYPKDSTSGCTLEAHDFSKLKADFDSINVKVFGISPDSPESHTNFRDKEALTVALLSDEEKVVLNAYGVWGEKSMYGRKYMGVERSTFLIDKDGKIAKIWRNVKVPEHAQAVLIAAQAL